MKCNLHNPAENFRSEAPKSLLRIWNWEIFKTSFTIKKTFCIKFTSEQLESSSFDNLSIKFRQMSQKTAHFVEPVIVTIFFPTNFLKLSSGQLRCSFDKTSEVFQAPSELFYSQIREPMEKHLVQKNNSRYHSGQIDCSFDNQAEKFSPKFWYLPHNLQIYPSKGLFQQIKNSLEKVH